MRDDHIAVRLRDEWRRSAPPSWSAGWTPRRFALSGGSTEVVELGEGPALLLVPPLPGYKEAWLPCALRLARQFRVVTFDLRARLDRRDGWDRLMDDLDLIADALAPGAIGVVGHSLGGALAQRWALARPDRVRALVLSSAFARVTTPGGDLAGRFLMQPLVLASQRWLPERLAAPLARALAARGAWVYDAGCDDAVLALVRCGIRSVPPRLAWERVRLAFTHDLRGELQRLSAPTLLVVGERETTFARQATAELATLIPGACVRQSPGAAHLHPLSHPDWFAATIADWLREAGPRA